MNANAAKKATDLIAIRVLLDKPRTLLLDFAALETIEEKLKRPVLEGGFVPKTMGEVTFFFWACLQSTAEGTEIDGKPYPAEGPIDYETVEKHLHLCQFTEATSILLRLMSNVNQDANYLAPYVPTHHDVLRLALELANLKADEIFWDLGAGDGRAMALAGLRTAKICGVERDKDRCRVARALLQHMKFKKAKLVEGLIQEADWDDADVIFVYLLPSSNSKLQERLGNLKPGARVVTHDFPMIGWKTSKAGELSITNGGISTIHRIYVYEIGKHLFPPQTEGTLEEGLSEEFVTDYVETLATQIEKENNIDPLLDTLEAAKLSD